MSEAAKENWGSGSAYEMYVGRWSRRVARGFIDWLPSLQGKPGAMWAVERVP